MTTRVEWAADALLARGEDVMPLLREKCTTVTALSTTISRMKEVVDAACEQVGVATEGKTIMQKAREACEAIGV